MNEFLSRQIAVSRQLIGGYRSKEINLDILIQNILGIGEVIEDKEWDELVFPIIWSMEQINSLVIEEKKELTKEEIISIENFLCDLESAIKIFEKKSI